MITGAFFNQSVLVLPFSGLIIHWPIYFPISVRQPVSQRAKWALLVFIASFIPVLLVPVLFFSTQRKTGENKIRHSSSSLEVFVSVVCIWISIAWIWLWQNDFLPFCTTAAGEIVTELPTGKLFRSQAALVLLIARRSSQVCSPHNLSVMNTSSGDYINKPVHVPFEHTNHPKWRTGSGFRYLPPAILCWPIMLFQQIPARLMPMWLRVFWLTGSQTIQSGLTPCDGSLPQKQTAEANAAIINHTGPNHLLLTPETGFCCHCLLPTRFTTVRFRKQFHCIKIRISWEFCRILFPRFLLQRPLHRHANTVLQRVDPLKEKILFWQWPQTALPGNEFDYCCVRCLLAIKECGYEAHYGGIVTRNGKNHFDMADKL